MKPVILYILVLLGGFQAWSQTARVDSLLNDVFSGDKEMMQFLNHPTSFCYLYGGIAGENKTFYAGRESGDNMVGMNGNIYFFHSWGFFAGASGLWYGQPDPEYSNTIVSAGINKALNRKKSLTFRASYSRYFYNNTSAESEYVYNNSLGAGLSLRNKWIGGRFSFNFLFGEDFGMNFTPSVFSRIPITRFGKYNKIQLEPDVSFFLGSETVEYESTGSMQGSQSSTTSGDEYGLLNTQFYLPVCIYIGNFDIELGYSVNIPRSQDESIEYPVSTFFSFSLGYLLPL